MMREGNDGKARENRRNVPIIKRAYNRDRRLKTTIVPRADGTIGRAIGRARDARFPSALPCARVLRRRLDYYLTRRDYGVKTLKV